MEQFGQVKGSGTHEPIHKQCSAAITSGLRIMAAKKGQIRHKCSINNCHQTIKTERSQIF